MSEEMVLPEGAPARGEISEPVVTLDLAELKATVTVMFFVIGDLCVHRYSFTCLPKTSWYDQPIGQRLQVLRAHDTSDERWDVSTTVHQYRLPYRWEIERGERDADVPFWASNSMVPLSGYGGRWRKVQGKAKHAALRAAQRALIEAVENETPEQVARAIIRKYEERLLRVAAALRESTNCPTPRELIDSANTISRWSRELRDLAQKIEAAKEFAARFGVRTEEDDADDE